MTDAEMLDDAKRRFLEAKKDLEEIRSRMANQDCPLEVGDRVSIVDGSRRYDGVVDHIGAALSYEELVEPVLGLPVSWSASGRRIKKGTGELGSWTFAIQSDAEFRDGAWHLRKRGLEATLGLAET